MAMSPFRTTDHFGTLQVRVLNIFRREIYAPVFDISPGVRPISPGPRAPRVQRAQRLRARAAGKFGSFIAGERSILVRFLIPFSFAHDLTRD